MTNAVIPFPFSPIAHSQGSHPAIAPLLDLALSETHSQGAYLYWFAASETKARIVLWEGPAPSIEAVAQAQEVGGAEIRGHFGRTTPIVVHQGAQDDPRFRFFPEFRKNRFEGVVSIPLLDGRAAVGLVNICRSRATPVHARDLAFLLNLSVPVGGSDFPLLTRAGSGQ